MKKWLLQFVQLAKQALVRHPIELLLVVICGAIPIFASDPHAMMKHYADFLLWALMAFMLVNLTHGRKYYRLSIFIPIAFVLLAKFIDLRDLTQSARFGILNLAVLVVFLCENAAKNNRTFMSGLLHKILNLAFALLLAIVFGGAGNGLVAAIEALFQVRLYSLDVYSRIWLAAWWWVFPLSYLSLSQRENLSGVRFNELGKILLNWFLSPALVVYTLIIYAYAVLILVQGKMPEGMIANVAFPYLMIGITLYVLQILLENEKWQKFYHLLPWLNLLPLAMLWYAMSIRIQHYGFTQERVYLVMGAVVFVLWNLILLVPKIRQYRLLAGVLLVVLLGNVFVIDAKRIAYQDQLVRFDNFVKTQQLLDGNGKLSEERINQWVEKNKDGESSKVIEKFRELHYAVLLNTGEKWEAEFKQKYGIPKEESAYKWMPDSLSSNYASSYFRISGIQAQNMDIQHYKHLVWFGNYVSRDDHYGAKDSDEKCLIHQGIIVNLQGASVDNIYVDCKVLPSSNYHQDFVLTFQSNDNSALSEWNLDEYLRNLFVSHNLVIHQKYTEQELNVLKDNFKAYIELDNRIILFDDLNIVYVERDNYKGYVFSRLTLKGILSK